MTDDAMTAHMFGSAPPAPQETAGEVVDDLWFTDPCLPVLAMSGDVEDRRVLRVHFRRDVTKRDRDDLIAAMNDYTDPTPAAATTDNTALVEAETRGMVRMAGWLKAVLAQPQVGSVNQIIDETLAAALSTRPAEVTSREGVTETALLRALLARAECFISGFKGDAMQDGIDELLREIRAGMAPC